MNYRLVVLGLLAEAPRYGYEIKSNLHDRFSSTIGVNNNTIYPLLRSFLHDSLVTKETVPVEGRPDRQVYTITDAGREELASMVARLPETDIADQDDFMIACTFLPQMDDETRKRLLDAREERVRTALRHLDRASSDRQPDSIQRLESDFGRKSLEAELDFIARLRGLLDQGLV
jgi:DNA-binding PadR family transcriptional regulator